MSQVKVDQYKKEKANRKETIAKEKRKAAITKAAAGVVCGFLAIWIGISAVQSIYNSRPVKTIYCETSEIDAYLDTLYAEE